MISADTRVQVRNDPSKVGIATGETREVNGRRYHTVQLADGQLKAFLEALLEPLLDAPNALADLAAGKLSAPQDLAQLLTHVRLTGDLADLIYSMEATNTDFHAFQFKPVIKVLNSASKGLLIADEVGLGKTIEAGLVWTELQARYDVERLLVVCPKSLQEKWRLELRNKFGARAQSVEAKDLVAALKEAEAHGGDFALVATLPGVRAPRNWEDRDAGPNTARAELARYLADREGNDPLFDMVVFDEAHHLRNPETAQHRTARLLVGLADYKLMLSATPINLKSEDLRSILRLIEPELFDRDWIFEELQAENEPIVAARELVLNPKASLAEVAAALEAVKSGQLLRTDRRLEILKSQLAGPQDDTPARRVEIASRLEEMSMLGGVVNRTRRRDVAEIKVQRRAHSRMWEMSPEEAEFYNAATEAICEYALETALSEGFLLANSQRMLASCLPAAYQRWHAARYDLGLEGDDEEDERPRREPGPLVTALAACCADAEGHARLRASDSKFAMFERALTDTWSESPEEKLIVFSSYQGTLDYLDDRLQDIGVTVFKMHGGVQVDRTELLQRFRAAPGKSVLLTSEIGGEGLDLQFCRILVNYDLPWNPMRVEQRVGRVDRIGQRAPSIEVFNLICKGTIEARIYERLYERLRLIEQTLGGFEPILGPLVAGLEGRLLDPRLKPEEVDEEIERQVTAAENRKRIEDELEQQAAGLIAHGDMILQRIKRAHQQQRWIQPAELYSYVRTSLETAFPGTTLDRTSDAFEAYELRMSARCHTAFKEFLEQRARRAETKLRRGEPVVVVFGKLPEGASRAEAILPNHPLIRFVAQLREEVGRGLAARPALHGVLHLATLQRQIPAGTYGLAVQRWSIGGVTPQQKLVYAGADLRRRAPMSSDDAESVVIAALDGLEPRMLDAGQACSASLLIKELLIEDQLAEAHRGFVSLEEAVQEDKRDTLLSVLRRQLETQRSNVEARIAGYLRQGGRTANIVPAERKKLENYVRRMTAKIDAAEAAASFDFSEPETLAVLVVEVAA